MTPACHTLRLVLGDQLNPGHSWFAQMDSQVVYVLMEVRQETDYVLHHAQKILAIFAAMRDFARQLRAAGHRVRYVALNDASNRQSIPDNLAALAAHYRAQAVQWQQPDEWRLDAQLRDWAATQPPACAAANSEHFLTARGDLAPLMHRRPQWLMEHFYRHMRRRHQVLLDAHGQPEGGQWNFDHDNRKPWPGTPPEPADWRPQHDHSALWAMIERAGVASFGAPQAAALRWPLNRAEALACLDAFITTALPHFGDYEDALAAQAPRLFHSLLSFALNVKMLHPLEVLQRAEAAWHAGHAPLAAVEGFVRQILGWREFVHHLHHHTQGFRNLPGNVLGAHQPLFPAYWGTASGLNCLDSVVADVWREGYSHHITRLMVLSNLATLLDVDPAQLNHWFWVAYIDAFDWVVEPNVLGMGTYSLGPLMTTKPYVSGAAYLDRMSDYCSACAFDPKKNCPITPLYWAFLERHREHFLHNPRMAVVMRSLQRRSDEQKEQDRRTFEKVSRSLAQGRPLNPAVDPSA